jgi:hypothetical protein
MRLVSLLATIGLTSTVVTASAGDKRPRNAGPPADGRPSRPRRSEVAAHASSTDRHVAEFLRWEEEGRRSAACDRCSAAGWSPRPLTVLLLWRPPPTSASPARGRGRDRRGVRRGVPGDMGLHPR